MNQMPKIKSTRLYLRTNSAEYRRLAWFHNNKPNEMLFGIYGLTEKQAVIRGIWPERELTSGDLDAVKYEWDHIVEVGTVLDHITCHADGTFHVKTSGAKLAYSQTRKRAEALGPDTGIFLELILLSDLANKYEAIRPKKPHVWVDADPQQYLSLRGMFSGSNHPLERDMAATMAGFPGMHGGLVLRSGTVKGILAVRPKEFPHSARAARPNGTILSFKFPVGDNRWHIKSLLLE